MTLREKVTEIASRWASLAARNGFDDVKWSEATAACARSLESALIDTADAPEVEVAKRARNAAEARERAAIEEGRRLAAVVANLRDEVASWRKGVEDANRIAQRERADADEMRRVAETVAIRSHELAERVERAAARAAKWEDEAVRFEVVASGSSIPIAREAASRLAADRRQHAAELRTELAPAHGAETDRHE
jgi:hypothetical protein